MKVKVLVGFLALTALSAAFLPSALKRVWRVGDVGPQGTLVPTGRFVKPTGLTETLSAAVLDCVLTPDRKLAILKTSDAVYVTDLQTGKTIAKAHIKSGASLTGLAVSPDGKTVACSDSGQSVQFFRLASGTLTADSTIQLPKGPVSGAAFPTGLAYLDDHTLAVACNRYNQVDVLDTGTLQVAKTIPVDTAPYSIFQEAAGYLAVTCWAAPNSPGAPTADASGTPVEVDKRGIGLNGSVDQIDLAGGQVTHRTVVGLQPTEIVRAGKDLFVACANGNEVVRLRASDLSTVGVITAPGLAQSAPDSITLSNDGERLYIAFGGLDRVGAFDLLRSRWIGYQRTAWYPTVVRDTPNGLLVGTAKGYGSRSKTEQQHSVLDFTATVSLVSNPAFKDPLPNVALDGPARPDALPVAVPERTGEPSLIKHVVYVIKENRTYDQLLGDLKEGNGDPSLVMYGQEVTPNHHAIAEQFGLLDNYYCSGVISADGHAWATESNATTYYEHSFGGWTRSYPFGDDPLATSSSGYIWDDALDHGRSVINFGEFDYAAPVGNENGLEVLSRFQKGDRETFKQNIGVARLRGVSDRDYPGWNLAIPDVLRADRFASRLRSMESLPDLVIVYLPQDHTAGGEAGYPTPRAQVADNDQGLGRVLDALSHSRFWKDSVLFAEEDDPQAGFDHVDGHRSICLVAGPYVKRRVVNSEFYNQCSVLHTIERILGLPPMNVNDAEAPVMTACFQPQPDLTPYVNVPNRIALDEHAAKSQHLGFNLKEPDAVDDVAFSRHLWALAHPGAQVPRMGRGDSD